MAIAADHDPLGALTLLAHGQIEVQARLVSASNTTLYGTIALDGVEGACVYKPVAGERQLWDFPDGTLAGREVSAYQLCHATGWGLIPPTVHREGPFGPGSVQLWLEQESDDPGAGVIDVVRRDRIPPGWLKVLDAEDGGGHPVSLVHADHPDLARLAALDVILNNADRKGGHVLDNGRGGLAGIDHGLTFNVEEKLRTVLWGWAGQPVDPEVRETCERLAADLESWLRTDNADLWPEGLAPHLKIDEVAVTATRARRLARRGTYPRMGQGWPAIPWPPF